MVTETTVFGDVSVDRMDLEYNRTYISLNYSLEDEWEKVRDLTEFVLTSSSGAVKAFLAWQGRGWLSPQEMDLNGVFPDFVPISAWRHVPPPSLVICELLHNAQDREKMWAEADFVLGAFVMEIGHTKCPGFAALQYRVRSSVPSRLSLSLGYGNESIFGLIHPGIMKFPPFEATTGLQEVGDYFLDVT